MDNVEEKLSKIFAANYKYLESVQTNREISLKNIPQIKNSVLWLKSIQHPQGFWGYSSVADTALAIFACLCWDPSRQWEIDKGHTGGIDIAISWLKNEFKKSKWEGAPWDTAIALRAFKIAKVRADEFEQARNWIESLTCEMIYPRVGIHHVAQRHLALIDMGANQDLIDKSNKFLYEFFKSHENWQKVSPYILGQCAWAISKSQCIYKNIRSDLFKHLWDFANSRDINNANFLEIVHAMMGIAALEYEDVNRISDLVFPKLFSENCYRTDFSWYREPIKTSWSLLVLNNFRYIKMIETYSKNICELFEGTNDRTLLLIRNERRNLLGQLGRGVILFTCFILIGIFWFYLDHFFDPKLFKSITGFSNWVLGVIEGAIGIKLILLFKKIFFARRQI
jgi:hypothetical protein